MLGDTPKINGVFCYVGYGIDILNADNPNEGNLKGSWLSRAAFEKDSKGNTAVKGQGSKAPFVSSLTHTGSSVLEVASSLGISAKVDANIPIPFFSSKVSIETKYGKKSERESTSRFSNLSTLINLYTFTLDATYSIKPVKMAANNIANEDFINDVNDRGVKPASLFQAYGTHMISQQSTGARMEVYYTYLGSKDISEKDFSAAVNFSSKYVSASGDVKMSDKERSILDNCRLYITGWGGDSDKVISDNLDGARKGFETWKSSVTENKASLSEIKALIPIWEFVNDVSRRDEIYAAFVNDVQYRNAELLFKKPLLEDGKIYVFENAVVTRSIDQGYKERNKPIYIHDTHKGDQQKWLATRNNAFPEYFSLKNIFSGYTMSLEFDATKLLYTREFFGHYEQLFKPVDNGDGTISLSCKWGDLNVCCDGKKSNFASVFCTEKLPHEAKWKVYMV